MITRACISINNQCNLNCKYCHFHEKKGFIHECEMDVFQVLDNIMRHIEKYRINLFKLGFVGNGEPLLDYELLKQYILHIAEHLQSGKIAAYTITNGLLIDEEKLHFFHKYKVSVGFSLDGIQTVHDRLRCGSYDKVMEGIKLYKSINGKYPPMNCTVGREVLEQAEGTISFFEQFHNRITFSRMIG